MLYDLYIDHVFFLYHLLYHMSSHYKTYTCTHRTLKDFLLHKRIIVYLIPEFSKVELFLYLTLKIPINHAMVDRVFGSP